MRQSSTNASNEHHSYPSAQKSQSSTQGAQGRVPSSLRENGMNIIGGGTSSASKNLIESRIPSGGPAGNMSAAVNRNNGAAQASTTNINEGPNRRSG